MTFNWNEKFNPAKAILIGILSLALAISNRAAFSQTETATTKSAAPEMVETFYLANTSQINDVVEIRGAIRDILPPSATISLDSSQNSLTIHATPEQMASARKLIADLDRTKKTYRLTFIITESDAGKRIGSQHYALILVSGQRTTLKQGSKVPIATGTFDSGKASTQTQFTYLDVGINIDSTLDDSPNGVRLKSKVEQSSIAESTVIADVREPIIRQSVIEGVSLLSLGKPLVLGGLDIPGSTRHLDIEAVVEAVK